jgi:RNA polymerase sigma-70 factor (ECF subfamily)
VSTFHQDIEAAIPALRRYARALTRDAETADDLVQDTLVRALRSEHLFHGGDVRSWLYTILTNLNRNRLRSLARRPTLTPIEDNDAPDAAGPEAGGRDIERALALLVDEQRTALLLVVLEGLTYREVAEVQGVPIGTVMSRLARARVQIKTYLDGERPRFAASNNKEGHFMVDHNTPVTEDELHVYVDGELPAGPPRGRRGVAGQPSGDAARVAAGARRPRPSARATAHVPRAGSRSPDAQPDHAQQPLLGRDRSRGRGGGIRHRRRRRLDGARRVGAAPNAVRCSLRTRSRLTSFTSEKVANPIEVKAEGGSPAAVVVAARRHDAAGARPRRVRLKLLGGRLLPGISGPAALFMYEGFERRAIHDLLPRLAGRANRVSAMTIRQLRRGALDRRAATAG